MAKKNDRKTDINQISLFDQFFNTQINNTNEPQLTNNVNTPQIPTISDSIGRESSSNDFNSGGGSIGLGTGENGGSGNSNVAFDGSAETGNLQINESQQNPNSIPDQTGRRNALQSENNGVGGLVNSGSSGTLPSTNEGANRPGVTADFKIDSEAYALSNTTFNKKRKYEANTSAINLLADLSDANEMANHEQQNTLASYVGFGGLKEILLDPLDDKLWVTAADKELRSHVAALYIAIERLSIAFNEPNLLNSAKSSILSSYYTPPEIIKAIYYAVGKIGFKNGSILEPSAGVGNFFGSMDSEMAAKSKLTGVELDKISGAILSHLYPSANIYNQGFQVTPIPEKSIDLTISNVPFGSVQIFDRSMHTNKNPLFKEASSNIHNYYFAKSLLLAKDNGLIAFVTSRYTLDSTDNSIRKLIAEEAEFLGAIRLGDNTFKGNAGTQVVSDIILLRKFALGEEKKQKLNFIDTTSIEFTDANNVSGKLVYNQYFHENPTHLLGTREFGGLYNNDSFNLKGNNEISYYQAITSIADTLFPQPILKEVLAIQPKPVRFLEANIILPGQFEGFGNLVKLENGTIGNIQGEYYYNADMEEDIKINFPSVNTDKFRTGNYNNNDISLLNAAGYTLSDFIWRTVRPNKINKEDTQKVDSYINIRNSLKSIIFYESNGYDDKFIDKERASLKNEYLRFISRYGKLNVAVNAGFKKYDPIDFFLVASLERIDQKTKQLVPADILEKRTIAARISVESAATLADAINISIDEYGYANINRISVLLDKPFDEIMANQDPENPQLFQNPTPNPASKTDAYVIKAEYLSGEVVDKLNAAKKAAIDNSLFEINVNALQSIQPIKINAVDIYSPLNASWVPNSYLVDFVKELTKVDRIEVNYSKALNNNALEIMGYHSELQNYSTKRKDAAWVIEHALNGIEPVVKYIEHIGDRSVTTVDPVDTSLAKENYKKIVAKWDDWKYKTSERRTELSTIYNDKFNTTVLRNYTGAGQHIELPGLIGFTPFPHQKDAIFRFTQTMGGIADHMVGAGKTLCQSAIAMELKRLGRVNKPCIIGLKSQIPQFYREFKTAYPLASVLFPGENDFTKENRPRLLNSIATNNWDCIIMSHEQFGLIQQPIELKVELIKELMDDIESERLTCEDKKTLKKLETRILNYQNKIDDLMLSKKDDTVLNFKQLGIDFLIVDECQEFKNLEFSSRQTNIRGLGNQTGSKRAFNMLVACRYLQKLHNADKGVLFCSGTPISNSMAELYLLFKYLTPAKLAKQGFTTFDLWAANYANSYADQEYSLGKFKTVVRFREFVNLPELISDYRSVADVRNNNNLKLEKPIGIHSLFKVEPNETQILLIKKIMAFIETKGNSYKDELGLSAGYDDKRMMNPTYGLLAVSIAKKLSLDPRLINPNLEGGTKIPAIANDVAKTYAESTHFKGTQLIFCDIGTPKSTSKVENLHSFLQENDTPIADIIAIFGESAIETGKFESIQKIADKMKVVLALSNEECNQIIIEANQMQTFNVYNEIKLNLIKRGIPENEIKYIHDFNTRIQKEELYKEMNEGTTRILIGSTRKMGTGLNVQKRICALVHADVCWKPSDMEQRNGRGERQGNLVVAEFLNNNLPIKYFATNRTLDASMYNIVAIKANFINQIKVENTSVRTMTDIGQDVDMGSFSAELSGDPIHKEKATLSKRVTELKLLKSSYQSKVFQIEDNIRSQERLIPFFEGKITGLTNTLPLLAQIPTTFVADRHSVREENIIFQNPANWASLTKAINDITEQENYITTAESLKIQVKVKDVVGDSIELTVTVPFREEVQFKAIVANIEYLKPFNAGKEMLNHVNYLKLTDEKINTKIAEVWGFTIIAKNDIFNQIIRTIQAPNGTIVGMEKHMPSGELALTLQIKDAILNIPNEIKVLKEKLIASKLDLEASKLLHNEGFPYQPELSTKSARLSEVDNLIIKMIEDESKNNGLDPNDTDDLGDDFVPTVKPKTPLRL